MSNVSNIITSKIRGLESRLLRRMNKKSFEDEFLKALPRNLHLPARFIFFGDATPSEKTLANTIEQFRSNMIASSDETSIPSYSSPKTGDYKEDTGEHIKPGPYSFSKLEDHAKTGANKRNGIVLKRLADGLQAKSVLELGTNTGLSGCYFLSSETLEMLVTIEGSSELCQVAEANMSKISNKFRLLNMLFDEALDLLLEENQKFDLIYLDGQHERQASMHYVQRVIPLLSTKGVIVLDDIYWSADMNLFWKDFCHMDAFSTTVDLQIKGIGILGNGTEIKDHFDICDYVGRPRIYRKD